MPQFSLRRIDVGAYALPSIPISALGLPLVVTIPPFYVTQHGVPQELVALIVMAVRLADIVLDPFIGNLSDRTRTLLGRRRPWLIGATPVVMLAAWMVFVPPVDAGALYLAIWLFVLFLAYAVVTIVHMTWGAELTDHYHERSRVQGWREFLLVIGMVFVLVLPEILRLNGADKSAQVASMGCFVMALLPLTVGIAVWRVGEPARAQHTHEAAELLAAFRVMLRSKPLRMLMLADLLAGLAPGITGALYVWFISYAVGLPQQANALLLIYFVAGFAGIPLWIQLSYRLGKHQTLVVAMLYGAVVLPAMNLLPLGNIWAVAFANVLYGLAYGAGPFLLRAIMADVTDHDAAVEGGTKQVGLYYSLVALTAKLGFALAIGISYPLLGMLGFDAKAGAANPPEAMLALQLTFTLLPAAIMAVCAWVMLRFPIDQERQAALREALAGKAAAQASPSE